MSIGAESVYSFRPRLCAHLGRVCMFIGPKFQHTGVEHTGTRHTGVAHTGARHTGAGHTAVGHTCDTP